MIDPSKIIAKIKYHLLVHLRADILRFGPLIGVSTETYECFNAIFRFCSILSNHLAPSRDIAIQLAEQEVVKHFLSGGYWQSQDGKWEQASSLVRSYLGQNSFLQVLLGYGHLSKQQKSGEYLALLPSKEFSFLREFRCSQSSAIKAGQEDSNSSSHPIIREHAGQ